MTRRFSLALLVLVVVSRAWADDNVLQGKDRYKQMRQGSAGTCWIDASIAALQYSGVDLSHRFVFLGENRYQLTLFNWNNSSARRTGGLRRVKLQVAFDGKTVPADPRIKNGDKNSYWVVLVHRAVIEAVGQWDKSQTIEKPHSGGAGDALAILTGRSSHDVHANAADVPTKINVALNAHKAVVLLSRGDAKNLVKNHYYAVLATSVQGVTLYNPWGDTELVSWDMIKRQGNCFTID